MKRFKTFENFSESEEDEEFVKNLPKIDNAIYAEIVELLRADRKAGSYPVNLLVYRTTKDQGRDVGKGFIGTAPAFSSADGKVTIGGYSSVKHTRLVGLSIVKSVFEKHREEIENVIEKHGLMAKVEDSESIMSQSSIELILYPLDFRGRLAAKTFNF